MSIYYINGPSLSSATSVFTNDSLTIFAPNGFYSDSTIVREQVSGLLLPQQTCPSCSVNCGEDADITVSSAEGVYNIDVNMGTATGAMIVMFNPEGVPDGVKATYNSVPYNKFSSQLDGLHQSTTPGNYTFIGQTSADCGLVSGSPHTGLTRYSYNASSGTFFDSGYIDTISVAAGDVSTSTVSPGDCMMVIPKGTASPSILSLSVASVCPSTSWGISVSCPRVLDPFDSSSFKATLATVCAQTIDIVFYSASFYNTPGFVGLYDFVFSDNIGLTPLDDAYYYAAGSILSGGEYFRVQNGIITEIGTCTIPCGSPISADASTGIYNIDLGLGSGTGAVIISFNPANIPDGIVGTLNSVEYNKLSSSNVAVLQSSVGGATYLGLDSAIGSCPPWFNTGGTLTGVTVYQWNGTSFVDTGTTESVTVAAGQIQTTPTIPGACKMVIPKSTSGAATLNLKIIGLCEATAWSSNVLCPAPLPSFVSSDMFATASISCEEAKNNTYYFAKVHIAPDSYVGLYDLVFTDENGEFALADGFYLISNVAAPLKVMQIQNGIAIGFTNCI